MLADYIQKYFWDIDPKKAKPKNHPEYYIERVLEYGNEKAFEWLKFVFGKEKIKNVAQNSRISKKSKNYWLNIL